MGVVLRDVNFGDAASDYAAAAASGDMDAASEAYNRLLAQQSAASAPSGGGWLDSFANLVSKGANSAVTVLDAYGRAKGAANAAKSNVRMAYGRDVLGTGNGLPQGPPRASWIPGISNGALIGGVVAVVGLVVVLGLSKKGSAA